MSGMDRLTDEALALIIDQLSRGNHRASLIEDSERAARELLAHRRASQAAPAASRAEAAAWNDAIEAAEAAYAQGFAAIRALRRTPTEDR